MGSKNWVRILEMTKVDKKNQKIANVVHSQGVVPDEGGGGGGKAAMVERGDALDLDLFDHVGTFARDLDCCFHRILFVGREGRTKTEWIFLSRCYFDVMRCAG